MSWVNPACYFNEVPGDAGLGITIPVNEYSRMIFGNPDRFEKYAAGNDRRFEGVSVRYGGVLLLEGALIINTADKNNYNCWLQSWIGATGDEQRDKYITDLDWKDDVVWDNKLVYIEGIDDYCNAQIHNPRFWEGRGKEATEEREFVNEDEEDDSVVQTSSALTQQFRDNFDYLVNRTNQLWPTIDVDGLYDTGQASVVSPFLWFRYTVKEMLRLLQWFVDDDFNCLEDNNAFDGMFIYNNFNINKPEYTVEPREIFVMDIDTLEITAQIIQEITGVEWNQGQFCYKDLIPRMKLHDFILSLQNYLNIVFFFRNDKKVHIIDREEILDSEAIDLDEYFIDDWIISEKKDLTLKFMCEYDEDDSMMSDEWHDLSDRRDDIADAVDTYEELIAITTDTEGTIRKVKSQNKYYEYKWMTVIATDATYLDPPYDVLGWEFITNGPQHYHYGTADEIEEIKTGVSTLNIDTIKKHLYPKLDDVEEIEVPAVLQKGNIGAMRSLWNNFSLRLLFWHTNMTAKPDNIYSTDDYFDEEKALKLKWDDDYGLIDVRWKRWARFWSTRLPVEGSFILPVNVISYIVNNITGKFRTRHGEFIIEEMETEFSTTMVGVTKIKGYKV
jgi:hypothetical protein